MNALIFLTTHIINKAVISEYKKLINTQGYDCVLAIDNSKLELPYKNRIEQQTFFNQKVKCFFFDENIHKELNLPNITFTNLNSKFEDIMWYNGDFRYYFIKKYFPDYDFYWQIEYDIFCNGTSYQHFLDKYINYTEDFLCVNYRQLSKTGKWYWLRDIDWIYQNKSTVYGSFFPITRLSTKAIDFLYRKRLEHEVIYKNLKDKTNTRWLHCELFVPTELKYNNFSCANIIEPKIKFSPEIDINEDRIFEIPDNQLYHPVKGQFTNRLKSMQHKLKRPEHIQINLFGLKIKFKENNFIKTIR